MSNLFLRLLNISITAGWIVLVVVLLRFVLKKTPKWMRVVLWGLVALRLLLPVSIESPLSLVPSEQTVSIATWTLPDTAVGTSEEGSAAQRTTAERVVFQTGFPALNSAINPTMKQSYEHHSTVSTVKVVAGWVWLAGVVGMLFYALISFLRLKHRVRASVLLEKGVYVCDEISDPFILGLIFPKIYLPSGMDEQTRVYVLAHERAHLKRFDHIWKPLGFLLLSVYWFNPLLWLAYILLCRDIELACDEKVVKELDDAGKAAYSEALVTASVSRRSIAACPLAFGETGVKSRVKSVLNYKKPAFWIILVAILACVAVAICFLTVPNRRIIAISESDRSLILQAQVVGDSPNNYQDPTNYHPILTDRGMFHRLVSDNECLAFRTTDGREIRLLDGFAGNIQYHSPYVYATIENGNWKDLPILYRVDLRNGAIDKFAEKVQIEYVYEDSYVLWWKPKSHTWYISDWSGRNHKPVLESNAAAIIPTPAGVYLYGDADIYYYEREHEIKKLYSFAADGDYIEQCYYINNHFYILYGNHNDRAFNQRLVELNANGSITEICTIDIKSISEELGSHILNIRLFLLPNSYLDAFKKWTTQPVVYEQEVEPGFYLFGIVSDRLVRIFFYRNAIVYSNSYNQEFIIPVSSETTPIPTSSPEVVNVSSAEVVEWLDYYNDFEGFSWDSSKEITVAAFPGVTLRWTAGSVEAVENGKTRTLFAGMPVWSVYFTDLTGDGKPELIATVSFGSGIVDEHIIVYDYVSKQSYVLLARMEFDFHLYTVDGALYVGKTPYMGDKQVDYGTLKLHDGVLSCRWQSDGSYTPLLPELHESELYGEWLVEEETDNDGNVLYSNDITLWKEYSFREDGTVVYNETVPISSDYEKAFGHPVEYPYEVHNGYVYIAGDDTSGTFRWGYYDRETQRLTLSYNTSERTVNQTLRRMGEPESSQKPYIGSWELFKIVDGAQEYDTSFLAAAGGIESDTLVLSEDGTGIRTTAIKGYETNEIALTFTPEQDETVLNVVFSESYAYGDVMTARYDSENDTISLYYPDDPTMYTVYIRSGSVIDAPTSKLTIDMLVGNWETEGNTAYDPPFLPGTLTFNKDGSAVLWLKDFLRSGEAIEYTVSLDGNMIWFADQTFASYDPNTDTIRLRLPLQSAGTLVFSRVSLSAEASPQPATSSDLSKEQADAFVNGLSVELEDGAPYGCDLVCYIDGFGTCLNVGDPNAFERASLRYEFLSRNNQNGSIDYAKILSVGELTYYIGDITVFADGDQLVYGEEWNDEYPSADASILVPVNPLMMDRNQSCPERCCVIRSFDPVNRTVTVSFGLQEEMSSDIPGEYVDYSSIETEQITLKVTDETFLTLVGNDYDTLVKPDRFFRFFEEYEFIDLYLFDENNEDASIGFWIGVNGDTLLYLCEMKEV